MHLLLLCLKSIHTELYENVKHAACHIYGKNAKLKENIHPCQIKEPYSTPTFLSRIHSSPKKYFRKTALINVQ